MATELFTKALEDIPADDAFWAEVETDLALAMLRLNGRAQALGIEAAGTLGVNVDFDAIHAQALEATRRATFDSVKKISDTTKNGIREALIAWQETGAVVPGKKPRGLPSLVAGLETLFDRNRAKRIAQTETTRLFAEGNEIATADDETIGGYQWQASNDEKVCPICLPKDDKIYPKGTTEKPPAHVRCRCGWIPTSWRYIRRNPAKWQGDPGAIPSREVWETEPTPAPVVPTVQEGPLIANTVTEAEQWATGRLANQVSYAGLTVESANEANRALFDMVVKGQRQPILRIDTSPGGGKELAHAFGDSITLRSGCFDNSYLKTKAVLTQKQYADNIANKPKLKAKVEANLQEAIAKTIAVGSDPNSNSFIKALRKTLKDLDQRPTIQRWNVMDSVYDVVVHEFGHVAHHRMRPLGLATGYETLGGSSPNRLNSVIAGKISKAGQLKAWRISEYAGSDTREHFAEAWTAYHRGEKHLIDPDVIKLIEDAIKEQKLPKRGA